MKQNPPEIGLRKSPTTPTRNQVYYCPVCEREFLPAPAYGSYAPRAVLSYVQTRYEKHWNKEHGNT